MYKYLIYGAFGWLAFSGAAHFIVDVLSQYARGKRAPSPETSLYYGLNSAYALGQVGLGLLILYLAIRSFPLATSMPVLALSALAALGWLAISFNFMEYNEPRYAAGLFLILIVLALLLRPR
jgi:hypothetical protein